MNEATEHKNAVINPDAIYILGPDGSLGGGGGDGCMAHWTGACFLWGGQKEGFKTPDGGTTILQDVFIDSSVKQDISFAIFVEIDRQVEQDKTLAINVRDAAKVNDRGQIVYFKPGFHLFKRDPETGKITQQEWPKAIGKNNLVEVQNPKYQIVNAENVIISFEDGAPKNLFFTSNVKKVAIICQEAYINKLHFSGDTEITTFSVPHPPSLIESRGNLLIDGGGWSHFSMSNNHIRVGKKLSIKDVSVYFDHVRMHAGSFDINMDAHVFRHNEMISFNAKGSNYIQLNAKELFNRNWFQCQGIKNKMVFNALAKLKFTRRNEIVISHGHNTITSTQDRLGEVFVVNYPYIQKQGKPVTLNVGNMHFNQDSLVFLLNDTKNDGIQQKSQEYAHITALRQLIDGRDKHGLDYSGPFKISVKPIDINFKKVVDFMSVNAVPSDNNERIQKWSALAK